MCIKSIGIIAIPKWLGRIRVRRAWTTTTAQQRLHILASMCIQHDICSNEKHNFLESSSMRDASLVHARLFFCRRIKWYMYNIICAREDDQPPRRSVIISRPTSTTRRRRVLFFETWYNIIPYYRPPARTLSYLYYNNNIK
jgi:hypothetical protein